MAKIIDDSAVIGDTQCPKCATHFEYTPSDLFERGRTESDEYASYQMYDYYAVCPKCESVIVVDTQNSCYRYEYDGIVTDMDCLRKSTKPQNWFQKIFCSGLEVDVNIIREAIKRNPKHDQHNA